MDVNLQKSYDELRHHLKIKFGLPPSSPSYEELRNILLEIQRLQPYERTERKWREIVYKYVKDAGMWAYHGLDNSDLNALYMQIMMRIGS